MGKKVIAVMGATGTQGGSLAHAILSDPDSNFAVRAITRDNQSERAAELARRGAEVAEADLDNPASVRRAFDGAYGAYCVTFYWAHFSPEKELAHARSMADAAKEAGVEHAIWSTLEDTRKWVPLEDDRMPTLRGQYKVPHFDAKGESDAFFAASGVPTTYMLPSFYWDNLIHFGMGPKPTGDGAYAITFPMGSKRLAGIAGEDIGRCAHGIFKRGSELAGRRVGVAGGHLTGEQMAAALTRALKQEVRYNEVSPDAYRAFGFPGADDLGNMFQFYRDFEADALTVRNVEVSRELNPALQDFDTWLAKNGNDIPLD